MNSNKQKKISLILFNMAVFWPMTGVTQQNLFNVPSSDITEKHKVFFNNNLIWQPLQVTAIPQWIMAWVRV